MLITLNLTLQMDALRLFSHRLQARFLSRPNRFLIHCQRKGRILSAFLPNPGRLQELLLPGCNIHLVREEKSSSRKTRYTAVAVDRDGQPFMPHTHRTDEVGGTVILETKIR